MGKKKPTKGSSSHQAAPPPECPKLCWMEQVLFDQSLVDRVDRASPEELRRLEAETVLEIDQAMRRLEQILKAAAGHRTVVRNLDMRARGMTAVLEGLEKERRQTLSSLRVLEAAEAQMDEEIAEIARGEERLNALDRENQELARFILRMQEMVRGQFVPELPEEWENRQRELHLQEQEEERAEREGTGSEESDADDETGATVEMYDSKQERPNSVPGWHNE